MIPSVDRLETYSVDEVTAQQNVSKWLVVAFDNNQTL